MLDVPLLDERQLYVLRTLPRHLANRERWQQFSDVMLDPAFLRDKLRNEGAAAILDDLNLIERSNFSGRPELSKLRAAVRLAARALDANEDELASQLTGRLVEESSASLAGLRSRLADMADRQGTWIRPERPSLLQAGSSLRTILPLGIGGKGKLRFIDEDRIIAISDCSVGIWSLTSGDQLAAWSAADEPLTSFAVDTAASLAIAADKAAIHAWDLASGRLLWTSATEPDAAYDLAIAAAKGKLLVLESGGVRFLDLRTGAPGEFCAVEVIECLAVTPDATGFLTGSSEGRIDRWEFPDREVGRFAHHGPIKGPRKSSLEIIAIEQIKTPMWISTPDALKAISIPGTAELSEVLAKGRLYRAKANPFADQIKMLSFDAGGRSLISCSADRSACIWSWPEGQLINRLPDHENAVTDAVKIPGRDAAATACEDGLIRIWDLNRKAVTEIFSAGGGSLTGVALSPNGRTVAAVNQRGDVEIYDVAAGAGSAEAPDRRGTSAISAIADPSIAVTIGPGSLVHRSLPDLAPLRRVQIAPGEVLAVTADGRRALIQVPGADIEESGPAAVVAVDIVDGDVIQRLDIAPPAHWEQGWERGWQIERAACDDGGAYVVAVTTGSPVARAIRKAGIAALWDFRTGRQIKVLREAAADAAVAITPDGSAALLLIDGELAIFNPVDGSKRAALAMASGPIAVTPDSRSCVVAGEKSLIWVRLGPQVAIVGEVAHNRPAPADLLRVNADGSLAATAYADASIALWSPEHGLLARFTADAEIISLLFIDASTLLAGDRLGRLHKLSIRPGGGEMTLSATTLPHTPSPWGFYDRARKFDTGSNESAAAKLWNEFANDDLLGAGLGDRIGLAPLGLLAGERLRRLGADDLAAALDVRRAASRFIALAERIGAMRRLEAASRGDAITELMAQLIDAASEPGDADIMLLDHAARMLARLGDRDRLRALVGRVELPLLVRVASAGSLLGFGPDDAAEDILRVCASNQNGPLDIALLAQRLLTSALDPRRAVSFLSEQYRGAAISTVREDALERILDLGFVATAARVARSVGVAKDKFNIGRSADEYGMDGAKRMMAGDLAGAIQAYETAVSIAPNEPVYHFNLGAVLLRYQRPADAIANFSTAIELKPDYEKAYCERGTAYQHLGFLELALENYTRAIELKPNEAFNYRQRAAIYRTIDELERAAQDEEMARRLDPDEVSPSAFDLVGVEGTSAPGAEAKDAAIAALTALGIADSIAADLQTMAKNPAVNDKLRIDAVRGLGALGRAAELAALARDKLLDDDLRTTAAMFWAEVEPDAARQWLVTLVSDRSANQMARHIAAQTIIEFVPGDLVALALVIPDLSYRNSDMSEGLEVALQLLRAAGETLGPDAMRALVRNTAAPAPLRELAGESLAIAGLPEGAEALRSLANDRRIDRETRETAARSLAIIESRRSEHEVTEQENPGLVAFEAIMNVATAEQMAQVALEFPFVTSFGFILQARQSVRSNANADLKARLTQNLAWLEALPAEDDEAVMRAAFDASDETQMRRLADRHLGLADGGFQHRLKKIVEALGSPGDVAALATRLRWMSGLPVNPLQDALSRIGACRTLEDVRALAQNHPIVNSPGFIESLEHHARKAGSEARAQVEKLLAWAREVAGDEGRLLDDAGELLGQGDHPGAIALLDRVIAGIEPPRFAFMLRGIAHDALDHHDRAIKDLTTYIERGGETARAYELRGRSLMLNGQARQALRDFDRALSIEPDLAQALLGRVIAHDLLGDAAAAWADMETLLELDPNDLTVLATAAGLLYASGDTARGSQMVERALTLDPGFAGALHLKRLHADGPAHALTMITAGAPNPDTPRRNDPCPCGSGARYKNCHGALA